MTPRKRLRTSRPFPGLFFVTHHFGTALVSASLPSMSPSASSESRTRAAGTGAPRTAMFFVQRGEETCRKRCIEIQEVLAVSMSDTKKYDIIVELMGLYTDEDSDVSLLTGVASPKQGPVLITDKTAVDIDPEARRASQASEPSSFSAGWKPPDQPPSSSTAAAVSLAGEPLGDSATTSDNRDWIEMSKQATLDLISHLQAAARADREHQI